MTIARRLTQLLDLLRYKLATPRILSLETYAERFGEIYRTGYWNRNGPRSGPGSTVEYTNMFRPQFEHTITDLKIKSIFDAPCGDWTWMKEISFPKELEYVGADIVGDMVTTLSQRHSRPGVSFRQFDIITDAFPKVDVWLCRDCLFHLSNDHVKTALRSFLRSGSRFAFLTSHILDQPNSDIKTGDYRDLDLCQPPFNLPLPLRRLDDDPNLPARRFVGVWERNSITTAIGDLS